MFLFTSLDKCCGDGIYSSVNGTCIFGVYIGVGTLLEVSFDWSSRVGSSLAWIKMIWKQINKMKNREEKLIFKKIS